MDVENSLFSPLKCAMGLNSGFFENMHSSKQLDEGTRPMLLSSVCHPAGCSFMGFMEATQRLSHMSPGTVGARWTVVMSESLMRTGVPLK